MKEPKIRFKGFKGEWEKKKLGAMTSVRGGYAFQSSLFQNYGIPVVRISNILSNGNVGGDFVYYPRLDGDTNITIHEKDVVIAMSGATTGKIARVDVGDGILYQNQRVGLFTKTGKVDYDFLYTVLNRPHFNELLNKLLTSSAQPNASSADIESIEMEFPEDAEEQKALSNYILSLDSLIQSTTKKIESLKQVKAASLQSMFPQEGETTPRVRFKGFEGEWEKVSFSKLYQRSVIKNDLSFGTDKIISVANMYYIKNERQADSDYLLSYNVMRLGDIAFEGHSSKDFAYGRFVENTIGEGIVSHVFVVMKPISEKYDISFWKYYINNERIMGKVLSRSTKASTMMNDLVVVDFLKESILVPSYEEQIEIGKILSSLDRQITLHTQRLEKLKQIKAACLDKMFV